MNFTSDLHRDLFDLLIHEFFGYPIDSEEYLHHARQQEMHFKLYSLFPQELAPVEYERYVSSGGLKEIKDSSGGWIAANKSSTAFYKHKIKIIVESN